MASAWPPHPSSGPHTCSAAGCSQPAAAWLTLAKPPRTFLLHPGSDCTSALSCAAPEAAHTLMLTSLCLREEAREEGRSGPGRKAPDTSGSPHVPRRTGSGHPGGPGAAGPGSACTALPEHVQFLFAVSVQGGGKWGIYLHLPLNNPGRLEGFRPL